MVQEYDSEAKKWVQMKNHLSKKAAVRKKYLQYINSIYRKDKGAKTIDPYTINIYNIKQQVLQETHTACLAAAISHPFWKKNPNGVVSREWQGISRWTNYILEVPLFHQIAGSQAQSL